MNLDEREFVRRTATWVAAADLSAIDTGLAPEEAVLRAREFQRMLREMQAGPPKDTLTHSAIDVLHGACWLLENPGDETTPHVLKDAGLLYEFILNSDWPEPDFGECSELLSKCALSAWRAARRGNQIKACAEWSKKVSAASPIRTETLRSAKSTELSIEDPETLLSLCSRLREQEETAPLFVRDEAEFLYDFLLRPERPIGRFDEREYFLGESALLAGVACRMLAQREDAVRWFDRSEANFRLTVNAVADWSRVGYHRLALCLEERRFRDLFDQLPSLLSSFRRLGMLDEAVKCRILEGLAQMETGDVAGSAETFQEALREARDIRNERLVASCCVNLVHAHGMLGNTEEALACSKEAMPILVRQNNRVALAQVQLGIGSLFRAKGQFAPAVEAYRSAMEHFDRIGMNADVAATRLMIADVLLEIEQEPLALQEVLKALPVIDEYRMVAEGMAALSLLRESVRQRRVNRQALRDLHGYFEDLTS